MKDRRPILTHLVIIQRDKAEVRLRTPYTHKEIQDRFLRPKNDFVSFESVDPEIAEIDSAETFVRLADVQSYSIATLAKTDIVLMNSRAIQ